MPFDPAQPAANSPLSSQLMRDQLNALDDRIATLEAALSGTARNPNLGTLNLALDDPPTRPQVQAMLDQLNTLLNQITRV